MNARPDVLHVVRQWLRRADADLVNAAHTLKLREGCPLATVCFHAQQCVEKSLKALLVLNSSPFPKAHDLAELLRRTAEHADLGLPAEEIVALNRHAVETRYPGEYEEITREDAVEALDVARRVRKAVHRLMPDELRSAEDAPL